MTLSPRHVCGAVLVAVLAASAGLPAHHSSAPFNTATEKTIEGMSPNYLARRGWSKSTLKPGDKITVVIRPMRDGSPGGMFVRATMSDGKVMLQSGQPTDQ